MDLTARFLNLARRLAAEEGTRRQVDEQVEQAVENTPEGIRVRALKQVQKRLPIDEILGLVESYRGGATVAQLTRQYGINRTTVLEHLERNGVARRPHVRKMSDAQVADAAEFYRQGWSHSQLGKRFFVSAETIRKELGRAGVQSRPPGRPPKTDHQS